MTTGKDMDTTEDMPEVVIEDSQPTEAVAADVEATEAAPQAEDIEEPTVTIEGEGDQTQTPNSGMTDDQVRKAWKEEREKRKRKNEELEQANKRIQEAEERARRAEELAIQAAMGNKPNPNDFVDAVDYAEAVKAYEDKAAQYKKQPESQKEDANQPGFELTEDQEFHAYNSVSELKKYVKDYDQSEQAFSHQLQTAGVNPDAAMNEIKAISHVYGIDYAKAVHAFAKVPGLFDELKQSATKNQHAIAATLRKAADKVKVHQPKKIQSQPEPDISGSSNGNSLKAQETALFNEWVETRDAATYNKLRAIRAKMKANT